jgi:hypothetical protein
MRFAGSVSLRPVRIGFLVPPDDLATVSRVARLCCCLWGGRYNSIIPFFEAGGERWVHPYHREGGTSVARGYVNFFEPDVLVEAFPGMAEKLGWKAKEHRVLGIPRVVSLDAFYRSDHRGLIEFAAGIDILDVITQLYNDEYKYERRHKMPFALVEDAQGNAFFDIVNGRYPGDELLDYIVRAYKQVFDPETLPPTFATAQKIMQEGYAGPIWISRHGTEEWSGRRGISDQTFYILDPTDAGDVIDYWNFRLVERRVIPISLEWLPQQADFIRKRILEVHRPIPGNPFGTQFHTSVQFAGSIPDERLLDLSGEYLAGLPQGSFFPSRGSLLWEPVGFGHERRETKVLATGKRVSFDEEVSSERHAKIPAPMPEFLNASARYVKVHWINVIIPSHSSADDDTALVYPSNIWSPEYPNLSTTRDLRIGREGWALQQQLSIGYSLLRPQTGREAIIGWLKTQGVDARPSEEGQVAAQVIAAAGGLAACGMFADRDTISLLNQMAEGHATPIRGGVRVKTAVPDRSKHINTIRQHFDQRAKRSFGFQNNLDYFLQRSVFRAGLRVQCPICSYQNWFDLNAISYTPTCSRCLNQFNFSQSHRDLQEVDWFYRVVGPFAAPDYARGGYSVALTLRCLAPHHDSEMTWSTGLSLEPLNCEVDFFAWYRPSPLPRDERDEPLMLIGEAKSFGTQAIGDEAINSLKAVADRFPGALMVVSSLREIISYSEDELRRLRELAVWGRRTTHNGWPRNPLIILTGTELFTQYGIYDDWKTGSGRDEMASHADPSNLYEMSELTLHRYLGLPGFRQDWLQQFDIATQRRRLARVIALRGARQ